MTIIWYTTKMVVYNGTVDKPATHPPQHNKTMNQKTNNPGSAKNAPDRRANRTDLPEVHRRTKCRSGGTSGSSRKSTQRSNPPKMAQMTNGVHRQAGQYHQVSVTTGCALTSKMQDIHQDMANRLVNKNIEGVVLQLHFSSKSRVYKINLHVRPDIYRIFKNTQTQYLW